MRQQLLPDFWEKGKGRGQPLPGQCGAWCPLHLSLATCCFSSRGLERPQLLVRPSLGLEVKTCPVALGHPPGCVQTVLRTLPSPGVQGGACFCHQVSLCCHRGSSSGFRQAMRGRVQHRQCLAW